MSVYCIQHTDKVFFLNFKEEEEEKENIVSQLGTY
jgi:hypothetical protein